jgi:hypothetical protein
VDTAEIERWYAELMRPPSTLERIAAGVEVPNQPMKKRKGRVARTFLRGLVGGFKGSMAAEGERGRAGGGRASSLRSILNSRAKANPEYEAARTDAQKALAEARRARAAEIGEGDPSDPLLEDKRAAIQALKAQREAAASAAGRRASAYEKRMGRAPASGGRGGGGTGKVTFAQERAALDAKKRAEHERLRGVITNLYGEVSGPYADPLAIAAYGRAIARVNADYNKRLQQLNEKYGAGLPDLEDEDELY